MLFKVFVISLEVVTIAFTVVASCVADVLAAPVFDMIPE
jgi:hypothetical protein